MSVIGASCFPGIQVIKWVAILLDSDNNNIIIILMMMMVIADDKALRWKMTIIEQLIMYSYYGRGKIMLYKIGKF